MAQFLVQEGYAYYSKTRALPYAAGEIVELEDIDEGEQGWKLVPVEPEGEKAESKKAEGKKAESKKAE